MKSIAKRFFLVFLSAWLLIGHVGLSYQVSDCLITGKKKFSWSLPVKNNSSSSDKTSISRAACYEYAHIQVKFSFDQQIKKTQLNAEVLASDSEFLVLCLDSLSPLLVHESKVYTFDSSPYFRPLTERLAFIQRYNI
ncbi:hypothetical protein [Aquirufa rosea]|uniref:Uncharacterized protein n=1 Tax=Aquirufa rosea TaxID=2509241 RepID=A0A4Q1BY51_9BACT|nr:hypothetical protein [Aquirufa rosea]RXK47658.1 hypothetical protein ESB04_10495 [Aquirufa rosea]